MFDFLPCNNCNNKRYFTIAHDLLVDGHHLIERKTKISWKVNGKYGHVKDFVLVYTRIIDGRSYKVTEIQRQKHQQSKVETFMTKDEVKRFEEDWFNMWNPDNIQKSNRERAHNRETSFLGQFP